jgi:DNA-binding MarR family transcriptional regulator
MPRAASPPRPPRNPARAPATSLAIERYLAAWRWRREVERGLKGIGLTFSQWFVLDATNRLIHESKDAVNQNAVAERTELDRMTVSQVMTTLAKVGHVDRDSDAIGRGYRIWVTAKGQKSLALAEECLTAPRRPR